VLERAGAADDSQLADGAESVPQVPATAPVPAPKPRPPGHGRNGSQAYSGAPIVECDHPELESGDRCPECDKGKVYDSPPKSLVKVVGQAPLGATVYRVQRLRCRLCDAVFNAPLPAAVASCPKFDTRCADMIAKAVPAPRAIFEELSVQAAQAPLLHSDDTPLKVLSLRAARTRADVAGEFTTIVANCLTHGRRQVGDVAQQFPEAARYVIEALAEVYQHDATCRKDALSDEQRLAFHQAQSKPILDELARWMNEPFESRLVEPNSGLGKALRYLTRHWDAHAVPAQGRRAP
jgi:hypothetical protein